MKSPEGHKRETKLFFVRRGHENPRPSPLVFPVCTSVQMGKSEGRGKRVIRVRGVLEEVQLSAAVPLAIQR